MSKEMALKIVLKQFLKTQDLDQAVKDISFIFKYNIGEIENIER